MTRGWHCIARGFLISTEGLYDGSSSRLLLRPPTPSMNTVAASPRRTNPRFVFLLFVGGRFLDGEYTESRAGPALTLLGLAVPGPCRQHRCGRSGILLRRCVSEGAGIRVQGRSRRSFGDGALKHQLVLAPSPGDSLCFTVLSSVISQPPFPRVVCFGCASNVRQRKFRAHPEETPACWRRR